MIDTSMFIAQLTTKQQKIVKETIEQFLKDNDFYEPAFGEIIQNAMDGRLLDLQDDLDLPELVKKLEAVPGIDPSTRISDLTDTQQTYMRNLFVDELKDRELSKVEEEVMINKLMDERLIDFKEGLDIDALIKKLEYI